MQLLTRFTPLILLSFLASCVNTNRFEFPYAIPNRVPVEEAVESLADQGFIVNEMIDSIDLLYSRSFSGRGSTWGMETDELKEGALDSPVGWGWHQSVHSYQPSNEMAIRRFTSVLKRLRKDYGAPRSISPGADCLDDELRADTAVSRAMKMCRVDSIGVVWEWDQGRGYHRITLEMMETNITVDFTVWGYH